MCWVLFNLQPPSRVSQIHPLLLAERAEACTVWLLRYSLHVTSAPPRPTHQGKASWVQRPGRRRQADTDHRQVDRMIPNEAVVDVDLEDLTGKNASFLSDACYRD